MVVVAEGDDAGEGSSGDNKKAGSARCEQWPRGGGTGIGVWKQKVELLEAFTGWESKNKYQITNTLGQDVFFAKENSDCLTRMCCGPGRPFEMNIVDNSGKEVIHLVRPLRCQGCCFPCCLQELEVHSPMGTIIGKNNENIFTFKLIFNIYF